MKSGSVVRRDLTRGSRAADGRADAASANASPDDQQVQAKLFELLGVGGLEFMGTIMERREEVRTEVSSAALAAAGAPSPPDAAAAGAAGGGGSAGGQPPGDFWGVGEISQLFGMDGEFFGREGRIQLPEGTQDVQHPGYREVLVPAARPPVEDAVATDSRISVMRLDEAGQTAFKGIASLNRLQSAVFPVAYGRSDNMLVCAPTGAGKTNVAMLTVCRELSRHMVGGELSSERFKVVYVAPMKALAAEVVDKFSRRLAPLGVKVRELTGDMQLTRKEIAATHMIVTTPEKWDVITRKAGEAPLTMAVKLLIIDEVHLLAEGRGAVIESLVARTLRLVESQQTGIRIVGLSATLPNYRDVADFLRVHPEKGLFFFGPAYRPVPLRQTFVGISEKRRDKKEEIENKVTLDKIVSALRKGKQAMVFVHSRKRTTTTATVLADMAKEDPDGAAALLADGWATTASKEATYLARGLDKSRNQEFRRLAPLGIGIHHAGMLRSDRNLAERMFAAGMLKVLVCTATLAWGVNLPAHQVIIKGTEVYNAEAGGFTQLSILDVTQIFGRAGRPQFDNEGSGVIITTHDQLPRYLSLLTHQMPIESSFIKALADHLNAEIVSGTVTNVHEAVQWLKYTYLYVRMLKSPVTYGIDLSTLSRDPELDGELRSRVETAARRLDQCRMARFDPGSGNLAATDFGRVASHYYLSTESMSIFKEFLERGVHSEEDVVSLVCRSVEFEQLKFRDEEEGELQHLRRQVPLGVVGDHSQPHVKCNILLQAYISRLQLRGFTLIGDSGFVVQSAGRVARGLFEMAIKRGWSRLTEMFLQLAIAIDKRMWWFEHPLRQLRSVRVETFSRLRHISLDRLCDMSAAEIGDIAGGPSIGDAVEKALGTLPYADVEVVARPMSSNVVRVTAKLYPTFNWVPALHGGGEPFWLWVEDDASDAIYHHEAVLFDKKKVSSGDPVVLEFTIPVQERRTQYWVRLVSDKWLGLQTTTELPLRRLIMPRGMTPHTDLLDLVPLPLTAIANERFQSLYGYTHFNPVQTQVFHTLYHTDHNVLIGAPTGSGKTMMAELSIFRMLTHYKGTKCVYVAPLKALVSERLKDWTEKLQRRLGVRVVELTGDFTPDIHALRQADVIVTTPEKWDGVSRSWAQRNYVKNVGLVIMDEIHLLGEDRGPILEVIVSRMRYIAARTGRPIRMVGLSTALANARDLADWLGIGQVGMFNFRPSVRPIPMEVHIQGFPGKHYCPRMASMNKPTYAAINAHSDGKPAIVFVSSRRQTRLTALDLISLAASGDRPRRFVRMPPVESEAFASQCRDEALRQTLCFGVGIHHAGLCHADRELVERLFVEGKILVLVCTSTLAWGVNFPAHLVVVKGTEYFDGKLCRYVDFPITDVLQMMGRAGRPQFDDRGVAVILVHEPKKAFYKKFLYEPFPVESQLHKCLADHLNAEVANGTIQCRDDAIEYLRWTYLYRRTSQNPSFYGIEAPEMEGRVSTAAAGEEVEPRIQPGQVDSFFGALVDTAIESLRAQGCVLVGDEAAEALGLDDEAAAGGAFALTPSQAAQQAAGGESGAAEEGEEEEADGELPRLRLLRRESDERRVTQVLGRGGPEEAAPQCAEAIAPREALAPTAMGRICSFYYLRHETMSVLRAQLRGPLSVEECARVMSFCAEFRELPVRHNEDQLNRELASIVPWKCRGVDFGSPHVKTFLLVQAHICRLPLPISDYVNDSKSALDQTPRVMNAMVDVARENGAAACVLSIMRLSQCIKSRTMPSSSPLLQLPGAGPDVVDALNARSRTPLQVVSGGGRGRQQRGGAAASAGAGGDDDGEDGEHAALRQLADRSRQRSHEAALSAVPAHRRRKFVSSLVGLPIVEVAVSGKSDDGVVSVTDSVRVAARISNARQANMTPPGKGSGRRRREYGWWVVLVNAAGRVASVRRLRIVGASAAHADLDVPIAMLPGQQEEWVLHLVCDAMRGLDTLERVLVRPAAAPIEAQGEQQDG